MKKGQKLMNIRIKKVGINGEGVANYKGKILFVPNALKNEIVDVRVGDIEKTFAYAEIIKFKKKSKMRVKAPCPVYEKCGGCQLQHMDYQEQLVFKKELLAQSLAKFKPEGYETYNLLDTIGMKDPWNYRNKAQFQLRRFGQKTIAGLYELNSHKLVEIRDCLVQEKHTQEVINTVVDVLNEFKSSVYNEKEKRGSFKTLMTRFAFETGEQQLVFITATKEFRNKELIIERITKKHPQIVSIMQNVHPKNTSEIFGEQTIHLWGKNSIQEHINEVVFDLSARAFFQLNPVQTSILYKEAAKALEMKQDETLVDAYCGVGTIGLSFAKLAKEIRGMDVIASGIADAKHNAKRMGLTNTHYEVGKAEVLLPKWLKKGFEPDAIIVDPPRAGLDIALRKAIMENPPRKLVYISCNVSTLARDMVELAQVYNVEYMQSVDMFPFTARCEVVVRMRLK
jgi:23S rRNA (uracil-5-)-methyltransferase RumA